MAGVARLVNFLTPDVGVGGASYQPYSLPADRLPNIADNHQDIYDPNNLVNRLLALDAPGKTLIFTDRPAKTFYVAVVEQRVVPQFRGSDKDKEFLIAYQDASLPPRQARCRPRRVRCGGSSSCRGASRNSARR